MTVCVHTDTVPVTPLTQFISPGEWLSWHEWGLRQLQHEHPPQDQQPHHFCPGGDFLQVNQSCFSVVLRLSLWLLLDGASSSLSTPTPSFWQPSPPRPSALSAFWSSGKIWWLGDWCTDWTPPTPLFQSICFSTQTFQDRTPGKLVVDSSRFWLQHQRGLAGHQF